MQNPVHYLHVFFFTGYYLCVIPFRAKRDKLTGLMQLHENRFQKFLCAIVHMYGLYQFLPSVLTTDLSSAENNSLAIFDVAAIFAGFGYQAAFMIAFWHRKHLFVDIFDKIQGNEILGRRIRGKRKVQATSLILCTVFGLTSVIYIVLGSGVVNFTTEDYQISNLLKMYEKKAKLIFFWDPSAIGTPNEKADMELQDILITSCYLFVKMFSRIQFHFSDLSILIFALLLHHVARDFVRVLKMSGVCGSSFRQIKDHYSALKVLMEAVNKVYSPIFLWWIFESMPYYAGHFDEIFRNSDILQRIRHGLYFVNYFSILVIAADGYAKISNFKDWLHDEDNYVKIDHPTLTVLLNELTSHSVGLHGKDYFTINYDFFTAMVSLIVTYAIIVVEFRTSERTGYTGYTNIL